MFLRQYQMLLQLQERELSELLVLRLQILNRYRCLQIHLRHIKIFRKSLIFFSNIFPWVHYHRIKKGEFLSMSRSFTINVEKIKHFLYLSSMWILLLVSVLIFAQATVNFTGMEFLQNVMSHSALSLFMICGAALLICFLLLIGNLLSRLSSHSQIFLTLLLALFCIAVQYALLFYLQAVLRYDHLRVFDAALEILRTGKLSLTANDSYFGHYPFNISIAVFNSWLLRIGMFFGVSEKYDMLALQCFYLAFIDLGILFSWQIVRILHSVKTATLFAILCFFNPILYVCAAGCYTTTLMLPLLMGTLLLVICFLKEQQLPRKYLLGFLFGFVLAFGSRLRATVFIAGIALFIYLLIRAKDANAPACSKQQLVTLTFSVLFGFILSFGSFTSLQNTYISEDYTDSQMPPIYYLMFAANPETKGSYNEDDYQLISKYTTLEQKNTVSFQILMERIQTMGASGTLSLANHKLGLTWSDGTEDYNDFLATSRNYSALQSFLGGDHGDFYALYCHIYHVAMMLSFLTAVIYSLRRKCISSYYLIFLTLLGGIIFHIFWESYYIYSFGFSMLIIIPASETISRLSERNCNPRSFAFIGFSAFAFLLFAVLPYAPSICQTEYKHKEYAVVQDMAIGSQKPLLYGERITQTFQTDRTFNRVGCKVYNSNGAVNASHYRLELLSENETLLASRDFYGSEILDKDYCYLEINPIIPDGKSTYIIQITPLYTSDEHYLTFGYYNTHNYDIYNDGFMTGLDSDAKSDLTFTVFNRVNKSFFHWL